jgi:hypothetical protein
VSERAEPATLAADDLSKLVARFMKDSAPRAVRPKFPSAATVTEDLSSAAALMARKMWARFTPEERRARMAIPEAAHVAAAASRRAAKAKAAATAEAAARRGEKS